MAFEAEGFCVVRGPDLLWGGDIRTFTSPSGRFDGVIGGPPCQAFSSFRHIVKAQGHKLAEDLIPEFERVVSEARPDWFLMENVPDAPMPSVCRYGVTARIVRDVWCGGETSRLRQFSFGARGGVNAAFHIETLALHKPDPEPAVLASGGQRLRPVAIGGSGKPKRTRLINSGHMRSRGYLETAIALQGLPEGFLAEAPFTLDGKIKVVGNGVPLPMGRAVAKAVKRALGLPVAEAAE
jgi:DNA (cytosine-5)-methyltransferase 1